MTRTSVYPSLPTAEGKEEESLAWCWAAVLIANLTEADSRTLRSLADAINGIYSEET